MMDTRNHVSTVNNIPEGDRIWDDLKQEYCENLGEI